MERMESCLIFVDQKRKEAIEYSAILKKKLGKEKVSVVDNVAHAQFIIVLGGDGTMLRAIHCYYQNKVPFLGINFGGKGFLVNDLAKNIEKKIAQGGFKRFTFPLLSLEIFAKNKEILEEIAVNDIYFNRMTAESCKLDLKIDGKLVVEKMTGDGLILSTALGSTAYNFAAGGSAVYPTLPVTSIAPICVHAPIQIKPLIFPINCLVEIKVLESDKRSVRVTSDFIEHDFVESAMVQKSDHGFELAFLEGEDFTERLVGKIMKVF